MSLPKSTSKVAENRKLTKPQTFSTQLGTVPDLSYYLKCNFFSDHKTNLIFNWNWKLEHIYVVSFLTIRTLSWNIKKCNFLQLLFCIKPTFFMLIGRSKVFLLYFCVCFILLFMPTNEDLKIIVYNQSSLDFPRYTILFD
jgi:hypothetical protein